MAQTRAADDFAIIRARMEELRRERERAAGAEKATASDPERVSRQQGWSGRDRRGAVERLGRIARPSAPGPETESPTGQTVPLQSDSDPAGSPSLPHDGMGDFRGGVSRSRINCGAGGGAAPRLARPSSAPP